MKDCIQQKNSAFPREAKKSDGKRTINQHLNNLCELFPVSEVFKGRSLTSPYHFTPKKLMVVVATKN
jgi:hypothetical protein